MRAKRSGNQPLYFRTISGTLILFMSIVVAQDSVATEPAVVPPLSSPLSEAKIERLQYSLDSLRLHYEERLAEVIDSMKTVEAPQPAIVEEPTLDRALEAKYFDYAKRLKEQETKTGSGFLGLKSSIEEIGAFQIETLNAYHELFFPAANSDFIQDFIIQLYIRQEDWANAEHAILKFIYLYPDSPLYEDVKSSRTTIFQTERYFSDKSGFLLNLIGAATAYKTVNVRYFKFLETLRNFPDPAIREKYIPEAATFLKLYPMDENAAQVTLWLAEAYEGIDRFHSSFITLQRLMVFYPRSRHFAEALFRSGKIREDNFGEYRQAIDTYYQFIDQFGTHALAEMARYRIAEISDVQLQDWEKAITEYQNYADQYPQTDKSIHSLIRKAEILSAQMNLIEESVAAYHSIVERYQDAPEARDALLRTGDLYVQYKKYDSATQEYLDLFHRYPKDTKSLEGLEKAADLYENKLGENEKAVEVLNYIVANFPGTREDAKAQRKLKKLAPEPEPVPEAAEEPPAEETPEESE